MRSGEADRPELVAVVDLGSTAVRLLLARITQNAGYHVVVQERTATRLGGGVRGTLPRAAIDETLQAVHRFFVRYSSNGRGPRVVAVATSAVREARNRARLLDPLRRNEGIEVQVLSARDEARLGVSAALSNLRFTDGLVADLGGASLQLSRGGIAGSSPARAFPSAPCTRHIASCATIHPRRESFRRSRRRSAQT